MIRTQNFQRRWQEVKEDVILGYEKLHSNEIVVNGIFVESVESKLKEFSGRKFALLLHSGSHAISMAIKAHNIGPQDEVIIPNYSCQATLSSVAITGCTPVMCEINEHGMMDSDRLQECLTPNTKAVLATGLYGDVHDHEKIEHFCKTNNIFYLNDAAQSQFALYKGRNSLELGDTVCMSFADNKVIPIAGTYGALLTDDQNIYNSVRCLRKNGKPSRLEKFLSAGYSSHPEEHKAVQILASMKHFRKWMNRRQEIGKIYDAAFAGRIETRSSPVYSTWNGHKYAIMVADKFEAYKRLLELGVETEQHYPDNFSKLSWIKSNLHDSAMTDKFVKQSLTIPNNPHMTDDEIYQVIDAVLNSSVAPSFR
jgi:dTDP-4-amino-4,6-dideoxygalactose transaminase